MKGHPKPNRVLAILCLFLLAVAVPRYGDAQVSGVTMSSAVADKSGAILAGAHILIRHQETGTQINVTANDAGSYTAPNLEPGPYESTAWAARFSAVVQNGIVLTVGHQQPLRFNLNVGAVAEPIEVAGGVPRVDLESSTLSEAENAETMCGCP